MRPSKLVIALTLLAAACGDPDPAANSANPHNGTVNGGTNNGPANVSPNAVTNGGSNAMTNGGSNQTTATNGQTGAPNNIASACAPPAAFDVGATYGNEVRVTGARQLQEALAAATPGTRITLAAGEYAGGISAADLQGSPEAPIAIVGEPGAVIVGGASALQLSDPAYVVLQGFTVRDAAQNGINIDDGGDYATPAHHVVIRDVTVQDIGDGGNQDCIKLSGLDDFHIEGVDLSGCSGQAIDMVGCHDGLITRSVIADTPGAGVQGKGGTADVTVHSTLFRDVAGRALNLGGSTGLEFFRPIDAPHEGARLRAYANVIVRPGEAAAAYVGCDTCEVTNNTIVDPQRWVARVLQETTLARFVPSRNGVFANNIVVFRSSVLRSFVNVGANTAPETFTFRNNLWWDVDNAGLAGPTLSDGIPAEVDGAVGDPGFAIDGADFRVDAGSPAAGLGADGPALHDHGGRCFADPPAAGAFEVEE